MKITYEDKESRLIDESVPNKNKVRAEDMNEIKNVINENDENAIYKENIKQIKTISDNDSYSCSYINNIATMETIFNGTGAKPTGTGASGEAITTTTKNPLDYDIVLVTVTNSGSTGEHITVPILNTDKVNNAYFYILNDYNASLRIFIRKNSIILQISEIRGWPVSNLYVTFATGIKLQNV